MRLFNPLTAMAVVLVFVGACSDDNPARLENAVVDTVTNESDSNAGRALENIVQTASTADTFKTLASLLVATGLDSVLADETRKFTVFAPTDDAFAKIDEATLEALSADSEALSDLLLYHVLADLEVDAATATGLAGSSVEAANGDALALSLDNGKLFINMSEVVATDVAATNGVIHAIDTVLMPPADVEPEPVLSNIVETAIDAGIFGTLVTALQAAGLDTVLADETSTFTVFAPTDEAFAKLGSETINALLADTDTLSDILLYHVIADSAIDAATALTLAGGNATTANGDSIALSIRDNSLFINDSKVITTDIKTSNGIIHVIDTVLLPPADVPVEDETPDPVEQTPPSSTDTIFKVAESAGFSTLVAAVKVAGMEGALDHPDDVYTVFAPTNEAFAALGQTTIDALLADPERLREIIRLHVLPGRVVDAATALSLVGFDIQAGSGDIVQFSLQGDDLFIQDAKIISPDVAAVNGVIHVIDKVLLP